MSKSLKLSMLFALILTAITSIDIFADDHRCVPLRGMSCEYEYKLNCPVGFYDGCETGETAYHTCVAMKGPNCATEILTLCPQGFINGCFFGESAEHRCVPLAGPSCDVELYISCPVGFVDYCSINF